MEPKLMVPVPARVSAWYLVPAALGADEARTIAVGAVGETHRALIERAECGLDVEVASTVASDGWFRRPEFVMDRDLVSVRVSCRTGPAAFHESVARALAAGLAGELGVPAIADAGAGQWISADEARASLHAKEDGSLRLSDWVRVAAAPDAGGRVVSLETVGLARYGLPELRAADVPSWFGDGWSVALTALAWRLRLEFTQAVLGAAPPGEPPWRAQAPAAFGLPAEIGLSADDVASAYCLRGLGDRLEHAVGLRLDRGFLTAGPPRAWAWTPRDYLQAVAEGPLKPALKAARVFDDLITGNPDLEEFALRF